MDLRRALPAVAWLAAAFAVGLALSWGATHGSFGEGLGGTLVQVVVQAAALVVLGIGWGAAGSRAWRFPVGALLGVAALLGLLVLHRGRSDQDIGGWLLFGGYLAALALAGTAVGAGGRWLAAKAVR